MKRMHSVMTVDCVTERMYRGEFPVCGSSYSCASRFDDGAEIPHQVMQAAGDRMGLVSPGRGQRWAVASLASKPVSCFEAPQRTQIA